MDIKERILALREELNQHNYNYYVLDTPTISDFEFDLKLKDLQKLEQENPIFFETTEDAIKGMLSTVAVTSLKA